MSNPWFTSHRPALGIKSSCSKTKRHDQIRYDLSKQYEDKMEKFEIMLKQQVKGKSKWENKKKNNLNKKSKTLKQEVTCRCSTAKQVKKCLQGWDVTQAGIGDRQETHDRLYSLHSISIPQTSKYKDASRELLLATIPSWTSGPDNLQVQDDSKSPLQLSIN